MVSVKYRFAWVTGLLFFLLGVLAYANVFHAPFLLDDLTNIVENPFIRMESFSGSAIWQALTCGLIPTRPLAYFSFALNYLVHGYALPGYHIVNLAIHILTGFVFFLLLTRTMVLAGESREDRFPEAAFWGALLWLLHPLQTNAVTYIVQRMTSMATLFYLLAIFLYVVGRTANSLRHRRIIYSCAAIAGMAALGSKEIAVTLPVAVVLYEWYFFQQLDRAWLRRKLPLLMSVIAVIAVMSLFFLGPHPLESIHGSYASRHFTLGERLLTESRVIFFYISLLAFPHPSRLTLEHDFSLSHALFSPPTTALALLGLAALAATAVLFARRQPLLSFAILWFFLNLFIESSFVGLELVFEHRLYLSSIFLFVPAVLFLQTLIKSRRFRRLFLIGVAAILCLWTYQRNMTWANPVRFWTDCVAKAPFKSRPYNELGLAYYEQNRLAEALPIFNEAVRLEPENPEALYNQAIVMMQMDRYAEAAQSFTIALRKAPNDPDIHNNLGVALEKLGRWPEAMRHYRRSLEIAPNHYEARRNLARLTSRNR